MTNIQTNNAAAVEAPKKLKKIHRLHIGTYVVLILFSIYILIPFWIMVVTSLKTIEEAAWVEFTWWPKQGFHLDAYERIFRDEVLLRGFGNTLRFYLPRTIIGVFVSAMSAYGFAKMEWKGREQIFGFMLLTMMIPHAITMTASRLMYDTIGWIGTALPITVPAMFGSASMVFFMRQYMKGIPNDLIGAAKVDGMSEMGIFLSIILPISIPAILTQILLNFLSGYNDYLTALLYLIDEPLYTLQIAINYLASLNNGDLPAQMATSVVGLLPMLILYFILQKFILEGISIGSGLKG